MAVRPWLLALAVAPLVLASAIYLTRHRPGRDAELVGAFAAEAPAVAPEPIRVVPQFERDAPPVAESARAPEVEPALSPVERASEVALDGVFGQVTDSFGLPLEGARVTLRGWRGPLAAELGVAVTDAGGHYHLDVSSWPSGLALRRILRRRNPDPGMQPRALATFGPVQERLTADLPGYGTVAEERTVAEVFEQPLRVDFKLPTALAVNGRVELRTASRRTGAPFAEVVLVDAAGNVAGRTVADGKGAYTLYVPDGRYALHARLHARGTAWLPEVVVDRSDSNELPSLELVGTNRMQGRVTYPDGSPVEGLVIEAEHVSIAPRTFDGLTVLERIELERSEGLAQSFARSGADGEFEFPALRGGEFQLRVPDCDTAELTGVTLQNSNSDAAHFTFHGRRVRVEVLGDSGSPISDAQVDAWRVERHFEPSPKSEVVAHAAGNGTFFLHVEPGERLFVRAFAEGSAYAWNVLVVSSLGYEERVRFVLGEEPESVLAAKPDLRPELGCGVTLEVLGDDGKPATGWRATATSAEGEVPAGWQYARPASDGSLPPLPPGRFRITLAPFQRASFHCFDTVTASVDSELGETRNLKLTVPIGGRLRFRIPPEAAGTVVAQSFNRAQDLELRGWSADVLPLRDKREPIALKLAPNGRSAAAATRALPGEEVEAFPTLLPGRYELRLTRPGSEARSFEVTVRAGETTTVAP